MILLLKTIDFRAIIAFLLTFLICRGTASKDSFLTSSGSNDDLGKSGHVIIKGDGFDPHVSLNYPPGSPPEFTINIPAILKSRAKYAPQQFAPGRLTVSLSNTPFCGRNNEISIEFEEIISYRFSLWEKRIQEENLTWEIIIYGSAF